MNALVKKFCNSGSEISDIINFLKTFEKKFVFEEIKTEKDSTSQYEKHPIIVELKKTLSELIFSKHFDQFVLSHNYLCKHQRNQNQIVYYKVQSILSKDPNKSREVKIQENSYICNCPTFIRNGLICRHIFSLMMMFQDKTLDKVKINQRWKVPNSNNNFFTDDQFDFADKIIHETEKSLVQETDTKVIFASVKRNKGPLKIGEKK